MNKLFIITIIVLFTSVLTFAQDDVQIGSSLGNRTQTQGGLFDYSDPSGINIKVQLWGYVKYPGYYIIPSSSNLNDILSFAGGPLEDAMMNDIRIYRKNEKGDSKMTKYNLNDLLWNDSLATEIIFPALKAGDIVLIPSEPRYFVREDIQFYLSITLALASITALIISITK